MSWRCSEDILAIPWIVIAYCEEQRTLMVESPDGRITINFRHLQVLCMSMCLCLPSIPSLPIPVPFPSHSFLHSQPSQALICSRFSFFLRVHFARFKLPRRVRSRPKNRNELSVSLHLSSFPYTVLPCLIGFGERTIFASLWVWSNTEFVFSAG